MMHVTQRAAFIMLATSVVLTVVPTMWLTGCQNNDAAESQKLIEQLTAETTTLKAEIATLKAQYGITGDVTGAAAAVVPTAVSPNAFSDVTVEVPGNTKINDLAALHVLEEGEAFKPYEPITRGEFITWLYKAYNAMHDGDKQIRMAPAFKVPFTDIKAIHPAYKYVQALANAGFSVGYDNKTFKPDQALTREEMIAIKHGTDGAELYTTTSPKFTDAAAIDKRFMDAIYADTIIFQEKGNIFRVYGPIKSLKPKEPVLRYEAAIALWQTDHRGNITADIPLGRVKK